jgi:serine/threonine-protein kinase
MAPEQARGLVDQIGPPTDVHGLGLILYELLTGRPAYDAGTAPELLQRIITEDPTPPRHIQPGVPAGLEAVCLQCLRKRPEERFPTAAALADALGTFLQRPYELRSGGGFWRVLRAMSGRILGRRR